MTVTNASDLTSPKPHPNSTIATRLAAAFKRHGVEVVFGQSLPTAFHLAAPYFGIRQASYRTENSGGAMADAYARVSNRVGVVTAQNGPAATLLVPPLMEAFKASIPVVALVQDVSPGARDRNAFQEIDHFRLFDACAKWVRRIDASSRVDDYVDMAFVAATSGRPGPAVLLVPVDMLGDPGPCEEGRATHLGHFPLDRPEPDAQKVREAATLLAEAESPLVIAGGGVHLSQAYAELARLQDECHLPVATTSMGKGSVSEINPMSLGVVGYFMGEGSRTHALRHLVEGADTILLVGNRTNQNGTDSWKLYPKAARYIHIDIDPLEIGRNYEAVRLLGDAKRTLAALAIAMKDTGLHKRALARPKVEQEIKKGVDEWRHLVRRVSTADQDPIRPERVMSEIQKYLEPASIVVSDASYSSIWTANYLTSLAGGSRFISPRGIAGLGWGLPMAIGAKLARRAERVVCVAGDGGFAHSWSELETLVRLELPVVVVVLNNQILGFQKDAEDVMFGEHTDACYFKPVDHAAIARACGCTGYRVEQASELASAMRQAFAQTGPVLLDILTDSSAQPPLTFYGGEFPSPF